MFVSVPSPVTKNIDQKGRGCPGKSLLGDEFLLADGALDEMPFAVLPFVFGGSVIDPSLGEFALPLVLRMHDTIGGLGFRSMQLWQNRTTLDDTVGKLTDFRGIVPSVTVAMDHPGAHAQATVTRSCL